MHKALILLVVMLLAVSCGDQQTTPKPAAMLALNYPSGSYTILKSQNCPYQFEVNEYARVLAANDCSMKIEYPFMNATVYMDYVPVQDNLRELLMDGQKLSFAHNRMADVIDDKVYINPDKNIYGMFYSIEGNAASNVQFYVTDSVKNFMTASLYFDQSPNYDSLYPAVEYVKLDMRQIIETLRWTN